jgi:hypothetical protein
MLKKIVSISGKPGLYLVISSGKNMLIVESLTDKKRMPAYTSDKVVSLGDVSMFTMGEDMPLAQILEAMKVKENGAEASVDPKSDAEALRAYFAEIVPDFDRERVYPTDIKKLIQWYNLLVSTGNTDFSLEQEAPATETETN